MMSVTLAQVATSLFTLPALAGAGAALVAIPLAIHLLSRFRRTRQDWGAMRFLWEAYQKQRRRLQMEQLILLLVRCALVLTIGLALAGPLLPGCSEPLRALGLVETAGRTVHVIVDDSLATRAIDPATGVARYDGVRAIAERVATESDAETVRFWRFSAEPRAATAASRNLHPELPPASTFERGDLSAALGRVAETIAAEGTPARQDLVVVVSPFAVGSADLQAAAPEAWESVRDRVRLIVTSPQVGLSNVQAAALQPRRGVVVAGPDSRALISVDVALRRFDDARAPLNATLRVAVLDSAGRALGESTRAVTFTAGTSEQSVGIDVTVDDVRGGASSPSGTAWPVVIRAAIEGVDAAGDALPADTARWSAVELRAGLRVGLIDEAPATAEAATAIRPARWAMLALAPRGGGAVEVVPIQPAAVRGDDAALAGLDAVVLLRPDRVSESAWSRLASFAEAGGLVWVTAPAVETSAAGWTRAMRDAYRLDWRFGVEPVATGGEAGLAPAVDRAAPGTLELLAAEWDALLRPVRVTRWAPVTVPEGAAWIVFPGDVPSPAGQVPSLLTYHPHGRGGLLYLAAALDPAWTNLPTKPVFVPLVHEAVRGTLGTSASDREFSIAAVEDGWRRLLPSDGEPAAREQRSPGVYDRRGTPVVANVDPAAGDTRAIDPSAFERYFEALGEWSPLDLQDLGRSLRDDGARGPNIGWALLWLVLALAMIETILARVFSHARDTANRGLTLAALDRLRRFYRVHHPDENQRAA